VLEALWLRVPQSCRAQEKRLHEQLLAVRDERSGLRTQVELRQLTRSTDTPN
jgi:hypothetical protein